MFSRTSRSVFYGLCVKINEEWTRKNMDIYKIYEIYISKGTTDTSRIRFL